jgi:hypothetical protein
MKRPVEARSNSKIPVVALTLYGAVVMCLPHSSAFKILLMQYVSVFRMIPILNAGYFL